MEVAVNLGPDREKTTGRCDLAKYSSIYMDRQASCTDTPFTTGRFHRCTNRYHRSLTPCPRVSLGTCSASSTPIPSVTHGIVWATSMNTHHDHRERRTSLGHGTPHLWLSPQPRSPRGPLGFQRSGRERHSPGPVYTQSSSKPLHQYPINRSCMDLPAPTVKWTPFSFVKWLRSPANSKIMLPTTSGGSARLLSVPSSSALASCFVSICLWKSWWYNRHERLSTPVSGGTEGEASNKHYKYEYV